MFIGLDLSLPKTGLAIVDKKGKVKVSHLIKTSTTRNETQRMVDIISGIKSYLLSGKNYYICTIEDTFYGKNFRGFKTLSRLVGAVQVWYFQKFKKEIELMMAVTARKLVGLKGNCHKSEVQLFVMNKCSIGTKKQRTRIKEIIDKYNKKLLKIRIILTSLRKQFKKNSISKTIELKYKRIMKARRNVKYILTKLSKQIEDTFKLSEHQADAIILAQAGWVKYGKR